MRYFNYIAISVVSALWRGRVATMFLAAFLLCSNTVLAANWVYLQRQEGTRYGPCTEYIDADSAIKEDDKVTYWTIWVFDEKSEHHNIMKILHKKETKLSSKSERHRILERYFFDAGDKEIQQYLESVKDYGDLTDEVERALGYAKPGAEISQRRPDHVIIPRPRWYGFMQYNDYGLYWDIHSIVAWPQDRPRMIDIRVKQVWSPQGIAQRKVFLASQKPYSLNKDNDVKYTVLSCRIMLDQPQIRILAVTDYDSNDQRITLLDGDAWKEVEPGTMEETIRMIAVNWIKNNGEMADQ